MEKKHIKTAWVSQSHRITKPWGHEIVWSALAGIGGKILFMTQGHRNSLKLNALKDECLFVLEGEVECEYGNELTLYDPVWNPLTKQRLEFGEHINIQSGCPYRITAITDAQIIEIGNSNLDRDIIRIEDDYGRVPKESKKGKKENE